MKSLISVSGSQNIPVNQIMNEGFENFEIEGEKNPFQNEFTPEKTDPGHVRNRSSANSKIVKYIRGGQGNRVTYGANAKMVINHIGLRSANNYMNMSATNNNSPSRAVQSVIPTSQFNL